MKQIVLCILFWGLRKVSNSKTKKKKDNLTRRGARMHFTKRKKENLGVRYTLSVQKTQVGNSMLYPNQIYEGYDSLSIVFALFWGFTFKCYGNYWKKTLYSLRVWIGYNWVGRHGLLKLWEIWKRWWLLLFSSLWQEVAERTTIILNVKTSLAGCFLVVGYEYPFDRKLLRFMKRNADIYQFAINSHRYIVLAW